MGESAQITISGLERHRVEGDQVQLRVQVEDLGGNQSAPDTLVIRYKAVGSEVTTKTLGTDVEVVEVDPGDYALDVLLDKPGTWYFRVEVGGNLVGADERALSVEHSQVLLGS